MSKIRICDICGVKIRWNERFFRVLEKFVGWKWADVCDFCWERLKEKINADRT